MTIDFSLHSSWAFNHCFCVANLSPLEAWLLRREALYQCLGSPVCDRLHILRVILHTTPHCVAPVSISSGDDVEYRTRTDTI